MKSISIRLRRSLPCGLVALMLAVAPMAAAAPARGPEAVPAHGAGALTNWLSQVMAELTALLAPSSQGAPSASAAEAGAAGTESDSGAEMNPDG